MTVWDLVEGNQKRKGKRHTAEEKILVESSRCDRPELFKGCLAASGLASY